MLAFTARIQHFSKNKEKTGWRYVVISKGQAEKLKPGSRVGFRVKGSLDQFPIQKVALLPSGSGGFILPINGKMRKATGKESGDTLRIQLELDERDLTPSSDFMRCLKDEHRAADFFKTLSKSHQRYFSKWIEEAKTIETKTKRITMAVVGLGQGQGFGEMIRANKKPR